MKRSFITRSVTVLLAVLLCVSIAPGRAEATTYESYSFSAPEISNLTIVPVGDGYGLEFTLGIVSGAKRLLEDYYIPQKTGAIKLYGEISIEGGNFETIEFPDFGSPADYYALNGKRVKSKAHEDLEPDTMVRLRVQHEISDSLNGKKSSAYSNLIAANMPGYIASPWALEFVDAAWELDLIPDELYSADLRNPISRAEFAAIAVKVYEAFIGEEVDVPDISPFNDTKDPAVLKAYSLDIVRGTSSTEFSPKATITRQDGATMLARAYKKYYFEGWSLSQDKNPDFALVYNLSDKSKAELTNGKFRDDASIADYAKSSVYFLYAKAVIAGIDKEVNGSKIRYFVPKPVKSGDSEGLLTREQALTLAARIVWNLS